MNTGLCGLPINIGFIITISEFYTDISYCTEKFKEFFFSDDYNEGDLIEIKINFRNSIPDIPKSSLRFATITNLRNKKELNISQNNIYNLFSSVIKYYNIL